MLIGAINDRQLVLSSRKRQSRLPKGLRSDLQPCIWPVIWNDRRLGALARIRCTESWVTAVANAENELAIMAANRRLINECSKRRNEIRFSRKQPEELCS